MSECIFCNIDQSRIIDSNDFFYVIRDIYPVTELHTLMIPHRHISSYFDLIEDEQISLFALLKSHKEQLLKTDPSITGFNIGVNDGKDAGQTIFHCHIHLIPRRKGDVANARGGVRGVIPTKQNY
jgi:ATP adenylyltransferase